MDNKQHLIDQMIEKLRRAEVPDDQIALARNTSETLLGLLHDIAAREDTGSAKTSIREVMRGMAGEPRK